MDDNVFRPQTETTRRRAPQTSAPAKMVDHYDDSTGEGGFGADHAGKSETWKPARDNVTASKICKSVSMAWIWLILGVTGVAVACTVICTLLGMDNDFRTAKHAVYLKRDAYASDLGLPGCLHHAGKLEDLPIVKEMFGKLARKTDKAKCSEAEVYLSRWWVWQVLEIVLSPYSINVDMLWNWTSRILFSLSTLTTLFGVVRMFRPTF